MKILSYGSRCITSQIDRIEDGFRSLGHLVNKMDMGSPDLIYANDIGSWDEAINAYMENQNAKMLLTILDLPFHLPACSEQIERVKQVSEAGVPICTISQKVANDLEEHCGVDARVIYQPIKDIIYEGIPWEDREIDYLILGRNHDHMKGHYQVTIPVINELDGNFSKLHTIGDGIQGAQNYGNVTDEQLNVIYNNTKYVFCPSKFEGLGLPMIEAMAAKAIPILYHWHPTAEEFFAPDQIFECNDDIVKFILRDKSFDEIGYNSEFTEKFRKEEVAKNIINVYESL
jgi:glycosyltransferase involved in cell wall biosynthesis